jgi:hypothetical protein
MATNARLTALADAVTSWADKRTKEVQHQIDLSKAIMRGRTGADRLANTTVTAATSLAVAELDNFLEQ